MASEEEYGISYSADIDPSDFKKSLEEINKELEKTDKKAEDTGKKIQDALTPKKETNTKPIDEIGDKIEEVADKVKDAGGKMGKVFDWIETLTGFSVAGFASELAPIIIDFTKELIFGEKALAGYAKGLDDFRVYSEEAAKAADDLKSKASDFVSVIADDSSPLSDQIIAFQQLQVLTDGRLDNIDLEGFKLKNNTAQWKLINEAVNAISFEKLKREFEEVSSRVESLRTVVIDLGDGTQSIQENTSDEFNEMSAYADQLGAQIARIEELNKLAAMTDRERLDYYKQQLETVKFAVNSWEDSFGAIKRNNEGALEFKNNLKLLSIAPLLAQYNELLLKISTATTLLDPNTGLKVAKEAQLKDIDAAIERLDKNNAADRKRRDELFKQRAKITEDLEWWNPAKAKSDADKAARAADAAARRNEKAAARAKEQQLRTIDELEAAHKALSTTVESETGKQIAHIDQEYDTLLRKAAKANLLTTKSKDGKTTYAEQLKTDREAKKSIVNYDAETKKEVEALNQKKKLYKDYEDFKEKSGKAAADRLYKDQINTEVKFIDEVNKLRNPLLKKQAAGTITAFESKRLEALNKIAADNNTAQFQRDAEWMQRALTDYSSYEQKKKHLQVFYQSEREKAMESGNENLLDGINEAENRELKALQASNSKKLATMEQFTTGAVYLTKKAVRQQIEILQELLKTEGLDEATKRAIESKVGKLNKLLTGPDRTLVSSQLDQEIEKKQKALDLLAKSGDTSSDAFKDLNDQLMRLKQEKAENSIDGITNALSVLSKMAPSLNELSSALNDTNNNTAKQIGGVFASLANGAGQLLETFDQIRKKGVDTTDAVGAAAAFVVSTIANIVSSAQAQKKAYEEFYLQNLAYQHNYNNALIEEIRLREGIKDSVFFNDYAGKIKAGLAAEIKAVNDYNEALVKLQDAQVITGTKKVRDWAAVGASTAAGAGAGAVVGAPVAGVGAAIGAGIGAAVGFIGGLLKKRTVVNVYDGLLKTYPKLIDEQGNLNKAMAEAIISSGKIEGSSRENLQYLISMNEQYERAKDQIEGVISDLAGSLGSDLMSSIFDDWANGGENAGDAFVNGVKKSIANVAKNLLFNAVFGDDFVALQNKIKQGFKTNGDPNAMVTSLIDFTKEAQAKGQEYENLLSEFAKQLKSQGINDVFGIADATKKNNDANNLAGAYRQASQQSIDLLSSHSMGMRVAQLKTNDLLNGGFVNLTDIANRSLDNLQKIERNTYNTVERLDKQYSVLKSIDGRLGDDAARQRLTGG